MIIVFIFFTFLLPTIFPGSIFDPNVANNNIILFMIPLYLGLLIIGIYFKFEESGISSKEISLIAIYSAFVAIARIPFVGIPSVQPVSYLTICAGYVFGPLIGFIIGGNSALLSNIFLGQGTWTIYQLFSWGLLGIFGGLLGKKKNKPPNIIVLAIIGFLLAYIYGWIMNIQQWLFIRPITFTSFLFANIQSFPFDTAHAVGNFVFIFFFGKRTINILLRYRRRFKIDVVKRLPEVKINNELT